MATKIKDGLFIGDAEASQDPEFIELNKITFVINCAGRQLPNLWEQHGLHYLTFPWTSDPDCTLFDGGNVVIEQITSFIDEALEKGDSVLVHSLEGTGRCIACVTAYLMFRHHWSFEKALDFLCNKRPDAAPNAGFVQQLYRLDLRLCERRYGQNKEPAEEERIRHDQWIPLVPGVAPGGQKRTQGFQVAESLASSGATQGKNAISTVIADAAAGRFGGAASMFPSLGRLTEVQEEEIVLVNSFLNSQPQIDALPPGRADYEDHVSKELHWIDRPRIDKLTAAGRHDHGNERRQHMIPVSPRTGRAVPERPGNSSYNALSRGNNKGLASNQAPSTLVGILKTARKVEQSTTHSRGQKNPSAIPALESEACELGLTPSGDTTAAVSGVGGAGGAPVASPSLSSSRRAAGTLKVDDEVVIEDLSEPQSDRWSGGDGGTEGCGLSEHETASGGETSSRGQAQGSGFSPEDGTDISSFAEVDERNVRPDVAAKAERQSSSFERGGQGMRGPVAPARPEERQAWDGASSGSKGRSYGRAQADEPRGEAGLNSVTKVKESETAKGGPPRATSTLTSYDGDRKHFQKSAANVGGRTAAAAAAARVATVAGTAAQPKPKPLRRGGSEGSLKHSAADISARISTTPNLLQQDKTRLPQAPGRKGAAKYSGKAPPSGLPGPGWGPDDVRRDDVGAGGQQSQLEPEAGVPTAEDGAQGKGQGGWGRKASESRLYAGLEGGGSLQQLAQTPNPQQRRLPSPRPQQELGQTHQGDLRQGSSEADSIFSQQRPSSAPPQRPDPSEDDNSGNGGSGGSGGGGIAAANSVSANKAGVGRTLASSSVGAAIQGYPAHGLMPSGTAVQISANNDRSGRKGAAASGGNASGGGTGVARPRLSSRSQDLPQQRLANAHRPRRDRGSNAGSLPRGIRTSQSTPPPPADSSRARIGSPAPSMTSDRSFGQGYSSSELNPPHGNRRVPGVTPHAAAPRTKTTGVVRPKAGTLPLPSRRVPSRSSGRDGSDRAGIGGESVRWANPAPRARQRHDHGQGFSGTYGYSGSAEPRGETGGGSVSSRTVDAYAHLSHGGGSGPQKYDGSGQQRHSSRAGGAPIYRSGSPAPVRGRKSVANAESSRFSYQQKSRGLDKSRPQAFGIPPGFRGYMASTTGGSGGGGGGASDRRTTTRRSQIPTTTATDRGRRHSSGSDGSTPSSGVPRASLVAGRSAGQRPSTSEGLGSGSSAGRRGRSASPAPRPNSASGRRRSASPSPASLYSGKIDSFARPRWV